MRVVAGAGVAALALFGIAYRWASSSRRPEPARRRAALAGNFLTLLAVAVGSFAAQSFFTARPEAEEPPERARIALVGSVVLLGAASGLRAGGVRARSPHVTGVRGSALIHSIRELDGRTMSGMPVFAVEADVSAPGVEPFRSEFHEPISRVMASTVREGDTFPVRVDLGTRRVVFDWTASPTRRSGFAPRDY